MWLMLDENISDLFSFKNNCTFLLELSKINILVGKNNSGKSYLMRNIIKHGITILDKNKIKADLLEEKNFGNIDIVKIFMQNDFLNSINNKYLKILEQIDMFDKDKKDTGRRYGFSSSGKIIYSFPNFSSIIKTCGELIDFLNITNEKFTDNYFSDEIIHNKNKIYDKIINEYRKEFSKVFDDLDECEIYKFGMLLYQLGYVKKYSDSYNNNHIIFKNYIPLLRSIRHPLKNPLNITDDSNKDIFKERIINEYGYDEKKVNIITGLDFYHEYKIKRLGNKHERKLLDEFESFLSNYFFDGNEVSIIPDEKTYELKININDNEDRFIYEVGDGITSLLIIIYNIFINESNENCIYFIEEPEQSFHAGFQRLLMNIISMSPKFKNCYFFFTTHSNHLIDMGNFEFRNVTNYLCRKNEKGILINVQNDSNMDVLEELGVNPSSVQIANKIIWVEGKYDAFYIRMLLNKKSFNETGRKYIEEYDYAFVPYGGSNGVLINFSMENSDEENKEFIFKAKKINPNFMIIMDDDGISQNRSSSSKIKRYNSLKEILGNKLYKLDAREIENIFPVEVIKKYFKLGLKKAGNYDLKFLDNIQYDDYKNKKLGEYLNNLVKEYIDENLKKITGREKGFVLNGFLYDKSKFHECVLEWINDSSFDYDKDIPNETKQLINAIEKFISKQL